MFRQLPVYQNIILNTEHSAAYTD